MSVITKVLKGTCAYWAPSGFDQYGQPTLDSPVELDCRWADVTQEIVKADGTTVVSNASVMVSADVQVGGILLNGGLDSGTDLEDPRANAGAYEILQFIKVPNMRQTEYVRVALL